jgi:nucleoside-diphosphate-sugar epimerase
MRDRADFRVSRESRVFLTGGTGLIGGELLRCLRRRGTGALWTLVRERDGRSAQERIAQRLGGPGAAVDLLADIEPVVGDIASHGLGLTVADRARIGSGVLDDRACRRANLDGVDQLIEFARRCERLSLLVYVSSACRVGSVARTVVREEHPPQPEHPNEYTRTKAEAERRLRESGLPLLIVRPSIVIADDPPQREFARAILWFLPLLARFEAVPIDAVSRLDIVPVSFVAEAILALLERPRRYDCYHVSAGPDRAVRCSEVARFLDRHYGRSEPLLLVPPRQWTRAHHRRYVDTPERRATYGWLRPYLPFVNMDVAFDSTRLAAEIRPSELSFAPFLDYAGDVLDRISLEDALVGSCDP